MPLAKLEDLELHYQIRGEGTPVLGVMGFGLDQRFWAIQIPAVTKNNKFITFDNRGVGRSTGGAPTSIDQMADDAVRLLDHLGIEQTVVYGVSMGGAIAQRMVLDHPDRVIGLILAVTWARPIEFMRRQHDIARMVIRAGGAAALVNASLIRMFTPQFFEAGQEVVDQLVRAFMSDAALLPDPEVLLAQLDALDKHDTLQELATVSCPTLVIGGKMDVMAPYLASREIAAAIPGAELATFETGHGLMVEGMQAVSDRVEKFLSQF